MRKYILIETSLFTAQMKAALKGYGKPQTAHFIEDRTETLRVLTLKNDLKKYYVLKWNDALGKPAGILPRYSENGNNPKVNKIMTVEEIRVFINENEEPTEIE